MAGKLQTIAFDADDTLWHNERFFKFTQQRFASMLSDYAPAEHLDQHLLQTERRNIGKYGYGVKGFTLSMIETAIEVTGGQVPASVISQIVAQGRDMLDHPMELLPHARAAVEAAAAEYHVMLITKGDLLHQERKLAQSGLGDLFDAVEIVSEKDNATYHRIFTQAPGGPGAAMMVGNSMKSDIRPVVEIGGWGVHVPHDLSWELEHAEAPEGDRFHTLPDLSGLAALISQIR